MGLVDFQAGLQGELMRRAAAQFAERKFAEEQRQALAREAMQERVFQSNEELKRAQLDATADMRRQAADDRKLALGSQAAERIPANTFIPENDPTVGLLRTTGLLQPQEERPAVLEGPLLPGDTGAARPKGFIKTASANQQNVIADNERAAAQAEAASKHQSSVDAETARHNRAMEGATATTRDLQAQLQELKIQSEKDKLANAQHTREDAMANAKSTTQNALDLADRLEKHKGFNMAYGNISSRLSDFSQDATDAGAIRDQLVAALTLPNLGALKGPMSDKDILFVKSLATRLSNPRISETEARKAVAEAKTFLNGKLMSQGVNVSGGGMGDAPKVGDVKTFPNGRKAQWDGHGWVAQ